MPKVWLSRYNDNSPGFHFRYDPQMSDAVRELQLWISEVEQREHVTVTEVIKRSIWHMWQTMQDAKLAAPPKRSWSDTYYDEEEPTSGKRRRNPNSERLRQEIAKKFDRFGINGKRLNHPTSTSCQARVAA